jgi:hypothetical protein
MDPRKHRGSLAAKKEREKMTITTAECIEFQQALIESGVNRRNQEWELDANGAWNETVLKACKLAAESEMSQMEWDALVKATPKVFTGLFDSDRDTEDQLREALLVLASHQVEVIDKASIGSIPEGIDA